LKTDGIIVIGIVVTIAVSAGVFAYTSQLPLNILLSDVNITPTNDEKEVTVVDQGRVSNSGSFNYTSKDGGLYELIFGNGFLLESTKYVGLDYTDKGTPYQENFSIPAGEYKRITAYAYPGKTINGNFQVSGGPDNDVSFFITTIDCKQYVKFSFTLFNSGHEDGKAVVKLLADNHPIWLNDYDVKAEEKVTGGPQWYEKVMIPDCNKHLFEIEILELKNEIILGDF